MLQTSNVGRTWGVVSLPKALRRSYATVGCGSTTQCVAAAPYPSEFVIATRNGGKTWSRQALPKGTDNGLADVSCGAANHCQLVVTQQVLGTTNGGRTWVREHLPKSFGGFSLDAVSCRSASSCVVTAYGSREVVAHTSNGGKTWSAGRMPSSVQQDLRISCGSTKACIGIFFTSAGEQALRTTNAGATWTGLTTPAGLYLSDIACTSATVCEGVAGNAGGGAAFAVRTTDGGGSWTTTTL
jgi:photosystem II stability/assembly factor-like uncharacterized protein